MPRTPKAADAATPQAAARKRSAASKPLTQRQMIDRITKIAQQRWQPRSSVKISSGPRGQVMIDVTVHAGDEPGLDTVDQVAAKARAMFDTLTTIYSAGTGGSVLGGLAAVSGGGDDSD